MAILDTFTGTDGTGIQAYSSVWAYVLGSASRLQLHSNTLATGLAASLVSAAQRTDGQFPESQFAEITISAVAADLNSVIGVAVRCQGAGSQRFYGAYAGRDQIWLFYHDGATFNTLQSPAYSIQPGNVLRLEVVWTGATNTLTVKVGAATVTSASNAALRGGSPGVSAWNASTLPAATCRGDNFSCSSVIFPAGSYPALVVADGAVAYWRLGETSGTTAVDVIGGANGTISGGVTLGQPGPFPETTAMHFNGTTGKIASPALMVPATSTVEIWFKTNATGTARPLVSHRAASPTAGEWLVMLVNDVQQIIVYADSDANVYGPLPPPGLNNNVWHHFVWTSTGSETRLYIDGAATSGTPAAQPHSALSAPVEIGADKYNGFGIGLIAHVAIYPTTLTAPQIAAHYAARNYGARRNLAQLYTMQLFSTYEEDPMQAYNDWRPITPSDSADLARVTGALWVSGAGDVAAVMKDNTMPIVLAAVPAGTFLPLAVRRVNATGTTATGLIGLYQVHP